MVGPKWVILDSQNPFLWALHPGFLYRNSYLPILFLFRRWGQRPDLMNPEKMGLRQKLGWPESLHRIGSFAGAVSVVLLTAGGNIDSTGPGPANAFSHWCLNYTRAGQEPGFKNVLQCTCWSLVNSGSAAWWNVRAKRDPWEPSLWPSAPLP